MKIYSFYLKTILLIGGLLLPLAGWSVTQKEMDQARTIAAKAYIRYANDGSGYLDDLNPTTMEELEAVLKPKEKENIKAFKAIPVPTDYKDWNKEKLVEYWAVTAFQNKGLLEKGRGGRIRARAQINKMTIEPPKPENVASSSVPPQSQATQSPQSSSPSVSVMPDSTLAQLNNVAANEIAAYDEEEADINLEKADNYTWVYIMILAILVAIVVALVVYASKVMSKPSNKIINDEPNRYSAPDNSETIERLESNLSDKEVEIAMLKKKLEAASKQNIELKNKIESLSSEISILRSATKAPSHTEPSKNETHVDSLPKPKPALRSIYLGRANIRGIFIRADRTLNVGNSVFVLETSDGFSGSFKVADSPAVWELALSNPKEYLSTACTGYNLDNPGDATRIVTESSGTAVFEGGCWRVIRKAKIRYE